jgi:hypothetical protein
MAYKGVVLMRDRRRVQMWASPDFYALTKEIKSEAEKMLGKRVSYDEVTDDMARFWRKEELNLIVKRRLRARKDKGRVF